MNAQYSQKKSVRMLWFVPCHKRKLSAENVLFDPSAGNGLGDRAVSGRNNIDSSPHSNTMNEGFDSSFLSNVPLRWPP